MVSAFRHVWPDSWGHRLDYILTNAVRALLDVPGATLLMLPRLLIDDAFRVQHRRAPRRRSDRARILAQRICRLRRQLPHRGHRAHPEQDRQGAHGAAPAQHAGAAAQHHHLAPPDGRGRDRHLQPLQGQARREHRASARRAAHDRDRPSGAVARRSTRDRNAAPSISTPTNSNRSPPRVLRSSSPRRASTGSR